jgi:thiosulfate reductase cytochrome b subunit
MVAWLLLTLLAVNLTTLFYRHWLAPRAADCTLRDLVDAWREALLEPADWAACLDSS